MNSKKLCLLIAIFSVSCQKINSAKKNLVAKQNVEACFGTQDITLNSTFKTPEKILILWNGYTIVDECKSLIQNLLVYEKTENVIHLQAGGYGYTDRPFYSLQIFNQGHCDSQREIVIIRNDPTAAAEPKICESFKLEYTR